MIRVMIVDVHTHIWALPQQMAPHAMSRYRRGDREPWQRFDAGSAAHRRAAEPVDLSLIHGLMSKHADTCVSDQQVAAAVAGDPHKRIGLGGVDPLVCNISESLDQIVALKLAGVTISPGGQAMHPCHSNAMKLYEQCQQRKLPVFVHGCALFGNKAMMEFARPELLDEVAASFPKLPIVVGQIGRPWIEPAMFLLNKHTRVYADISDLVDEPWQLYNALRLAHRYGASEKLLLGSGFPFCTARQAIVNLYSINHLVHGTNLPTIPRSQLDGIIQRDVLSYLGINPPFSGAAEGTPPTVNQNNRAENQGTPSPADPQARS